jgi:hypothetical protein
MKSEENARHGIERKDIAWKVKEMQGMAWNGMTRQGMAWDGMESGIGKCLSWNGK